jgi:integrase
MGAAEARRQAPARGLANGNRDQRAWSFAYRALVTVSVLTGLRQGEALGLRWQDVDTREGVIRVRRQLSRNGELVEPKTSAAKRDVPIPSSLARMLAEARLASRHSAETDFVFASSAGPPLAVRNVIRTRSARSAGCAL